MVKLNEQFKSSRLPAAFLERYKTADGPALKVAVYLLCTGAAEPCDIEKELSMSSEIAQRSIAFWKAAGLISDVKDGEGVVVSVPAITAKNPLSVDDVAELTLRNPELSVLLQETQYFLGRPIDSLESRMLVEMYEYDELPVDVILMIVAYCSPRAKSNRSVVNLAARCAAEWREQGVRDSETAYKYIKMLEQREEYARQVATVLGVDASVFTKPQRAHIARWFEEYGYGPDFVKEVYLRTGKDSVNYINTVLKSWFSKGYRTIRDTRVEQSNVQAPGRTKKGSGSLLKKAIAANRED